MKKKSKLKKLAAKYVNYSFKDGKGDENKIMKIMGELKSLPRSQAIYIISKFLKGVRKRKDQTTLLIESAVSLTEAQLEHIFKSFRKEFVVTEIKNIVNPSLLGGFRVRIGDIVQDYSLEGKILKLREAITV
ncbi:hypothetical protein A2867_04710 [Candidatus Daviesbacteria bacterium RIFCSPHIGHO2_01_FULL_40_11]|uniref:Uncharacterized protein n=1 Tax=Candidatus Daviesbacteria bacterium RIFCSPHIGHO2_01_FULL_40_11 TaxID=1797762 RepID=A0A1F5JJE0_9BACT|nr:MAG: hypothetical protein A2867_04710 [Candidatus Daviesbacteria bacterium RIFCSPHIGHO2_01_FULL_40_11]OGE62745.1 MAG: hypothetical protein A2964_00485 [Candidatus Daviesbacteria bacterium RIFCSPLOWO2_01_FULL_40_27]